jgi:hypothetical protein
MKRILLSILTFITINVYAQQKGISYQAVILNPKSISAPGADVPNTPLANKNICMLFEVVDGASVVEYQESVQTTTDQFGMVNLTIGNGNKSGGYASSFSNISWALGNKRLVVKLNATGACSSYTEISNQPFMFVPYALYSENATVSNGSITAAKLADATITDAKIATGISASKVGLGNVNNTSDANKPVSFAAQAALDTKENSANKSTATNLGSSNVLFPTQNAVKTYVDSKVLSGPKGDTGAAGATGATGLQGVTGLAGPTGNTGAKGDTGAAGDKGDTGAAGAKGDKGDTGLTGTAGDKGDTGAVGATGLAGPTGNTGAKGDTGPKGDKGDTGATGLQGVTGLAGPTGNTGAKGDTGAAGDKGDTGAAGAKGDTGAAGAKGEAGAAGAAGVAGVAGAKGEAGVAGAKGDKGDTGLTGTAGAKGDTGAVGATGLAGPTGNTGAKGDTGAAGAKGDTGATGLQGPTGNIGVKGDTGAAGAKGDTGATGLQGPTGNIGVKGDTGAAGVTGATGLQGATGNTGLAGNNGAAGAKGDTGAVGAKGDTGANNGITYNITNSGSSGYVINGSNNPKITVIRGMTYIFAVNASGHPFWLQTVSGSYNSSNNYSNGVSNQGAQNGIIMWQVPFDAPNALYYVCQFHSSMNGQINVTDAGPVGPAGAVGAQGPAGRDGSLLADADATTKGKIQLAGDLGGTATVPTVPALANKVDKVTGERLINAAEITKLANQTGTNTGDQTTITGNAGSATNLQGGLAGSIPYQTAVNTTALLANGTSGQVLTSQGSTLAPVWSTPAASGGASVTEVTDEVASSTAAQTSFTLTQTPSINSKVKMYINGIRISNTAYTISAKVVTYNPANNGAYALSVGDRIQFDYYY